MRQCWRCRSTISENAIHHINGNHEDENPQNLLRLCPKCHDLVQGICDKCEGQKDCYVQKLQRCWAFEDAIPPIYFHKVSTDGLSEDVKQEKRSDFKDLIKIGHNIESSMISETYMKTTEFLENFVRCDYCRDWVRWKLSPGMERLVCARCVIGLCGSPREKKKKKEAKWGRGVLQKKDSMKRSGRNGLFRLQALQN